MDPITEVKAWYRSKTIIVNAVMLLMVLLAAAEPLVPTLQGTLPPQLYAWIAFALPIVNVGLRFITTGPVGSVAQKDAAQ